MGIAPKFDDLKALNDEDLKRAYDDAAGDTQASASFYLSELNRRAQDRQTAAMLRYTRWVAIMTGVITVATLANLAAAVWW